MYCFLNKSAAAGRTQGHLCRKGLSIPPVRLVYLPRKEIRRKRFRNSQFRNFNESQEFEKQVFRFASFARFRNGSLLIMVSSRRCHSILTETGGNKGLSGGRSQTALFYG